MYFFYFDESGSRDPSVGTSEKPKGHIYVLLALGMYERQWHSFDRSISDVKLELADCLRRDGSGSFELSDCEVKSNWLRYPKERAERSPFLDALGDQGRKRLVDMYYSQLMDRNAVIIAAVIDKRYLHDHFTEEILHKKAYEFVLERIEMYMREYHDKHQALIVMDDTSKGLNRAVAMKHAYFQREGNKHLDFRHIVEYPFFTASELSNGVQLADLLAYNVYRAFSQENMSYPYFQDTLPYFYRRKVETALDGLKVWPDQSTLVPQARTMWDAYRKNKTLPMGEGAI